MSAKIKDLPNSNDEYWIGSETNHFTPHPIDICSFHTRGSIEGEFKLNKNGTVSCTRCPYGFKPAPYMRLVESKIVVVH